MVLDEQTEEKNRWLGQTWLCADDEIILSFKWFGFPFHWSIPCDSIEHRRRACDAHTNRCERMSKLVDVNLREWYSVTHVMPCRLCYECWRRKLEMQVQKALLIWDHFAARSINSYVRWSHLNAFTSFVNCHRIGIKIEQTDWRLSALGSRHSIELRIYLFSETCECCEVCTLCNESGRYESTNDDGRSFCRCVEHGRRDTGPTKRHTRFVQRYLSLPQTSTPNNPL